MTDIVTSITEWQQKRANIIGRIGFVPTMGNLHAGHAALLDQAKRETNTVVASIFVNPTQFNDVADYERYPKTLEADIETLRALGVDYLFLPTKEAMYPNGYHVKVQETMLSHTLEGEHRPGHFDGMLTIVLKLFNIIQPHYAYFGEKDYQQLLLIKKMVEDLFLPIQIIACNTVRADNGLALSSRNNRLTPSQYEKAVFFAGLLASSQSVSAIKEQLIASDIRVDYIEEKWGRRLGAVWVSDVRLIDNVVR